MKTNTFLYCTIILITISCNQKKPSIQIAQELQGKVFELSSPDYQQARTIEFKQSTYSIYEDGIQNLEWRAPVLSKGVLILNNQKIKIKKENDSVFYGQFKTDEGKNINFKLVEKNADWSIKQLSGTWMLEKDFILKQSEEESEKKMIFPKIETPKGLDSTDFEPFSIFKINNRKLIHKKFYDSTVSEFDVVKTNRYMALTLKNPKVFGAKHIKIMSQKDSLMYVDLTNDLNKPNDTTQLGFLKLIKIRLSTTTISNAELNN